MSDEVKKHSKKTTTKKYTILRSIKVKSRKILGNKLIFIIPIVVLLLAILAVVPVFKENDIRTISRPYSTQNVQDSSIELGDKLIKQKGTVGELQDTYSVSKSLINILLGTKSTKEVKVSSKVTKEPQKEIIAVGTRKYQYMQCSNGEYRYYPDDQFKNPNVGFTSKSEDYCAKNNQGIKKALADSVTGSKATANVKPYIPSNCTTVTIPYTTSYQNVSYLTIGQTQTSGGIDGYRVSCSASSSGYKPSDYTIQPTNKVVYQGTGSPDAPAPTPTTSSSTTASALARQKCTSDYNSAKAQIGIAGAGNSSAMVYLQQLYSQCLSRAGY